MRLRGVVLLASAGCSVRKPFHTPSGSFVANCLKYATVSGCFAVYRFMYEALTASRADLGRYGALAPRPGTRQPRIPVDVRGQLQCVQGSHPSRLSAATDSRGAADRPLVACCSPFVPLALSAVRRRGARRYPREGPPAFHVKPGGDTRADDRGQGSKVRPRPEHRKALKRE